MGLLSLFSQKKKGQKPVSQKNDPERYKSERQLAVSGSNKDRLSLAKDAGTHREILYYLAENDPDSKVRKALVQNTSLPMQASGVLAKDNDVDVRLAIAERLIKLLPELSNDKQSQLYAYAVQALGDLALDEVLKIRLALTSALKDHAYTPPKVAGQLARDVERKVSEPILKFCAALADDDLLDILSNHPASWAVQAIAGRENINENISNAVITTEDIPAGQILIENPTANISKQTLMLIVEKARNTPEWQKPTALRKSLPKEVMRALMSFVDDHVRSALENREDIDDELRSEIAEITKRRVSFATENSRKANETALGYVKRLAKAKQLNEDVISDALAMRDNEFVIAALAHLAKASEAEIQKVIDMKSAKSITALCWHCKLSMRFTLRVEQELAHIPSDELIYPKDGTDFPLSDEDMSWQMEFLGFS